MKIECLISKLWMMYLLALIRNQGTIHKENRSHVKIVCLCGTFFLTLITCLICYPYCSSFQRPWHLLLRQIVKRGGGTPSPPPRQGSNAWRRSKHCDKLRKKEAHMRRGSTNIAANCVKRRLICVAAQQTLRQIAKKGGGRLIRFLILSISTTTQ